MEMSTKRFPYLILSPLERALFVFWICSRLMTGKWALILISPDAPSRMRTPFLPASSASSKGAGGRGGGGAGGAAGGGGGGGGGARRGGGPRGRPRGGAARAARTEE